MTQSLADEASESGKAAAKDLAEQRKAMLTDLSLMQYKITGDDADWEKALKGKAAGGTVSIKNPSASAKKLKRQRERAAAGAASSTPAPSSAKKPKSGGGKKGKK